MLRDDLLELRRSFHRCAYQHKTVKKMEQHMVDTLILLQQSDLRIPVLSGDEVLGAASSPDMQSRVACLRSLYRISSRRRAQFVSNR